LVGEILVLEHAYLKNQFYQFEMKTKEEIKESDLEKKTANKFH